VNQSSQGTDTIDSAVNVTFDNSTFCGNFADGTNGLWEVEGLSYVNSNGENSSLNGNYYGNASNWGIQAVLQNASKWIVKNNSFIGTLTIDETSEITTEDGTPISIYTDVTDVMNLENPVEELAAGTYHNVVIVTDADSLVLESTPVTAMASGDASGDAKQVQTGGTMTIPIVLGILFVVSIICIFIIVTRKDESSQK
jgi:hypothetical protein